MAIVLLQMGGPSTLDEIEPFLDNLFRDPHIIQLPRAMRPMQGWLAGLVAKRRAPLMSVKYDDIGGGSPLNRITDAQGRLLAAALATRGAAERVHVCNRYTPPRADTVVQDLIADESPDVTLLPLYPHWSRGTTGSSVEDFLQAARAAQYTGRIRTIDAWGEHPAYVRLLAAQVTDAVANLKAANGEPVHLILSAHGLPKRYVEQGDPYPEHVSATARLVVESVDVDGWSQAYQSAIGPVEWLRPYTDEHLAELAADGVKNVVLVPLGFVSDHIETLYDVDITFADVAEEHGMGFVRTPSFNEDPAFAEVLADVLHDLTPRHLDAARPEAALEPPATGAKPLEVRA